MIENQEQQENASSSVIFAREHARNIPASSSEEIEEGAEGLKKKNSSTSKVEDSSFSDDDAVRMFFHDLNKASGKSAGKEGIFPSESQLSPSSSAKPIRSMQPIPLSRAPVTNGSLAGPKWLETSLFPLTRNSSVSSRLLPAGSSPLNQAFRQSLSSSVELYLHPSVYMQQQASSLPTQEKARRLHPYFPISSPRKRINSNSSSASPSPLTMQTSDVVMETSSKTALADLDALFSFANQPTEINIDVNDNVANNTKSVEE